MRKPSRWRWPAFLDGHAALLTEDGRRRVVRHGHLPEREIMTGIGPVAVRVPRVRDRAGHPQARLGDDAQCLPVILGAPQGKKEPVGLIDGVRERAQSWRELLLDLKRRGLKIAPERTVADGALGFCKATEEVWPKTRGQGCWVHKTANLLNKLPKSPQAKAKRALHDIWMAETRAEAETAFDAFIETDGLEYHKAAECLAKDREALLSFYNFPAEHWKHLRTTNPIESTFATVRHRCRICSLYRLGVRSNRNSFLIYQPSA